MKKSCASAALLVLALSGQALSQPRPTPPGNLGDRLVRLTTADGRAATVLASGVVGCRSITEGIAGWNWSDGTPEIVVRELPPGALGPLSMVLTAAADNAAPQGDALAPFLRQRGLSVWRASQTAAAANQESMKDGLVAVLRGADLLGCDSATKAVAQELASQIKSGAMSRTEVVDRLPAGSTPLLDDVAEQYDALYHQKLPPS